MREQQAYQYYREKNMREYNMLGYAPKECYIKSCELDYLRNADPRVKNDMNKLVTREELTSIDEHCYSCTKEFLKNGQSDNYRLKQNGI